MTSSPRVYTKVIFGLVGVVAAVDLLLYAAGSIGPRSLGFLGVAAGLALLGALAWEVVARTEVRPDRPGVLPWIAFPASMILGFAAVPFLAVSIHPPLEGYLFRVEARFLEGPGAIEVAFPRPVRPGPLNLSFGGTALPRDLAREEGGAGSWKDARVLRLDWARLSKLLPRRPATLEVNSHGGEDLITYESGEPVPTQVVPIK